MYRPHGTFQAHATGSETCAEQHGCGPSSSPIIRLSAKVRLLNFGQMRERADIRILVAIGEEYHSYREVIAASVRLLRPHVEVLSTGLAALEQELADFDPQLVVSSEERATIHSPPIAWVRVSTREPTKPTEIWMWEDRWEATTPKSILLAQVIDSIEEKLAKTDDPTERSPLQESPRSDIRHAYHPILFPERTNRTWG